MPDFSKRSSRHEIMDDLNISGTDLDQALRELEIINHLLGGNYVTINGIDQLVHQAETSQYFDIVDLGCGGGDILIRMRKFLNKKKFNAKLTGIDANENVINYARAHTLPTYDIKYEKLDIFSEEFKSRRFDIVTGTLFFHHFTSDQLVLFFRQLRLQTTVGLIINDIHRHWFAYYAIKWLTQLWSRSKMVRNDAPQSVLRAFRKKDLIDILRQAGISQFKIHWQWAFRWQVIVRFD